MSDDKKMSKFESASKLTSLTISVLAIVSGVIAISKGSEILDSIQRENLRKEVFNNSINIDHELNADKSDDHDEKGYCVIRGNIKLTNKGSVPVVIGSTFLDLYEIENSDYGDDVEFSDETFESKLRNNRARLIPTTSPIYLSEALYIHSIDRLDGNNYKIIKFKKIKTNSGPQYLLPVQSLDSLDQLKENCYYSSNGNNSGQIEKICNYETKCSAETASDCRYVRQCKHTTCFSDIERLSNENSYVRGFEYKIKNSGKSYIVRLTGEGGEVSEENPTRPYIKESRSISSYDISHYSNIFKCGHE